MHVLLASQPQLMVRLVVFVLLAFHLFLNVKTKINNKLFLVGWIFLKFDHLYSFGTRPFCTKVCFNLINQTKFVKTKRPKVILVVSIDLFCSQIVNFSTMETIMFVKKLTMETQCYNSLNYFGSYTTLIHYELLGAKLGFSFQSQYTPLY